MSESAGVVVGMIVGLMTVALLGYVIVKAFAGVFGGRGKITATGSVVCPHCGSRGEPKKRTKGSLGVEILAWLLFIIPGVIYSLWRLSSREDVCAACGQPGVIPVSTPKGQALVARSNP